jgi:hypothetical protein
MLGKKNIEQIEEECESLLERAVYYTKAKEGLFVEIKADRPTTIVALTILNEFGLLANEEDRHVDILGTFKITEAGQKIFDTYFKKQGELFNDLDWLVGRIKEEEEK